MKSIIKLLHHFFVPSEHNNFRAKGLHLDVLTFFLLIGITINTIGYVWPGKTLGYATDITIEKLFQKTNDERTEQGLPPLKYNNTLAEAARNKAQDMFTYNYWAHYRPGDGTAPWDFIKKAGYTYEYAGENLAQGFLFSDMVVNGWMGSSTHRANILRPEYDEIGFAVMNGVLQNQETTLVVQMFGKPVIKQNQQVQTDQQAAKASKNLEKILEQKSANKPIAVNKASTFSLESLSINSSFAIIALLLLILGLDLYFAMRLKLVRIGGKNLAHWLFLGSIAIALLIVRGGIIL